MYGQLVFPEAQNALHGETAANQHILTLSELHAVEEILRNGIHAVKAQLSTRRKLRKRKALDIPEIPQLQLFGLLDICAEENLRQQPRALEIQLHISRHDRREALAAEPGRAIRRI